MKTRLQGFSQRHGHDVGGVRPVMIPDENGIWTSRSEAEHLLEMKDRRISELEADIAGRQSPEDNASAGEDWDGGRDFSKATHYHTRYRCLLWLEDGMSSARCWTEEQGWFKSYWYDLENFLPRGEWTDEARVVYVEAKLKELSK